ncbi:MAG: CPBP family intramembrane glutamic endopeptidase [Actinomycetota bacterium]|nr:CPBP family intramembrane glutamic endopeptidase [Actinomycetota bacterium]
MRVQPSVKIGIVLALGYTALFGGLVKISGVGYADITATAENARNAIVIPLAIIAVVLIAVTTFFGWWKPVLRDEKRATGWVIIVPIVLIVAVFAGVNYRGLSEMDSTLLLWIGIAAALIGFCEELMYRGLVVVSFRSTLKESQVWLWSSVAFALLHSINYLLGQGASPTVRQVIMTFVIGSGLYIARRTTGLIIVPMIIHLVWDYSAFTAGDYALSGPLGLLALVVVVIALAAGHKHLFAPAAAEATA